MLLVTLGLASLASVQAVQVQTAEQPPVFREWSVPWADTRPRDPYIDPTTERIWFCGQAGNYLAYLVPSTGEFKRFEFPNGERVGPHNLIVDKQGYVWYAGNLAGHIGRLDPRDGSFKRYPMPDSMVRDPHTLTFDQKGDIWFTAQGGNAIGRLTVATGKVELVKVPTPNARPYGIKIDSKNRPWVVLFGTNKLATVDPATLQLREIALPRAETRPRRMAITSDDKIYYGDYAGGVLGRYDPATGKVDEWPLPGGTGSRPYAMVSDDFDRVWVAQTSRPNTFVAFDPQTLTFSRATEVPSGGGTVRHMIYDAATKTIWFGADANTVGKAVVPARSSTPPTP
jgi:virginiamycin B lyase